MNRIVRSAAALAVAFGLAPAVTVAAQRVFVKSDGSDANTATGCLFANPCRSFAAALTQVDPGGEVVALDAAGYGPVTITQSVTLTANPGYHAGISASSGAAVTIATPDIHVVLRNLQINGVGANNGVAMTSGESLTVENCVISNFLNNGINVNANARVRVTDTTVRGNGGGVNGDGIYLRGGVFGSLSNVRMSGNTRAGLMVEDAGVFFTIVTMTDSDSSGNTFGAVVRSTAEGFPTLTISRSTLAANLFGANSSSAAGGLVATLNIGSTTITGNGTGLVAAGDNLVRTTGDNFVRLNTTNIQGPLTFVGGT